MATGGSANWGFEVRSRRSPPARIDGAVKHWDGHRSVAPRRGSERGKKEGNILLPVGHPHKTPPRASLRSENCPAAPEWCPTGIGTGVRQRRNTHRTVGKSLRQECGQFCFPKMTVPVVRYDQNVAFRPQNAMPVWEKSKNRCEIKSAKSTISKKFVTATDPHRCVRARVGHVPRTGKRPCGVMWRGRGAGVLAGGLGRRLAPVFRLPSHPIATPGADARSTRRRDGCATDGCATCYAPQCRRS